MPDTVSESSLSALPTRASAVVGSFDRLDAQQPAVHEVADAVGCAVDHVRRATRVSAMMWVAAVVETSTCASLPRDATAPDRSGSQVTAASTWRALNIAAAGASWVKDDVLFHLGALVGGGARTAPG